MFTLPLLVLPPNTNQAVALMLLEKIFQRMFAKGKVLLLSIFVSNCGQVVDIEKNLAPFYTLRLVIVTGIVGQDFDDDCR